MVIVIECKDTDNIIGAKEDIAMRLEGVADILRIDIYDKEKHDDTKRNDTRIPEGTR